MAHIKTWMIMIILLGTVSLMSFYLMFGAAPLYFDGFLFPIIFVGILIVIVVFASVYAVESKKHARIRAIRMSQVDQMTGVQFEEYVGAILKSRGYGIKFTPASNDYGVDIIAKRDGIKYAIQLKRYKSKVDRHAVNDAYGGINHWGCDESMAITNSYFTQNAINLSITTKTILIDRDKLSEWILKFQNSK